MDKKDGMPWWVYIGLMNIYTRKGGMILVWASFAFAIFCIPLSYYLDDWSWAAMMFPLVLYYWLCVRWVDQNSSWDEPIAAESK